MAVPTDRLHVLGCVSGNMDFYEQLGRRIAALRKVLDLSQERLGERARVGSSYVAHIEIGSRKPTIDVLLRLADALNVPLWRLLTDDRFTPDEKAWDAASRDLADKVRGLAQADLQALSYLATRLATADAPATGARTRPVLVHPTPARPAARAAEGQEPRLRRTARTSRRRSAKSRP